MTKMATRGAREVILKKATQWIEQSYRLYFSPKSLKIGRVRNSENDFQKGAT